MLQVLESPLEKKAGINYGPPGTKSLIYFVDDLNMPKLDAYETAMPVSLIRQVLAARIWLSYLESRPKKLYHKKSLRNPNSSDSIKSTCQDLADSTNAGQ